MKVGDYVRFYDRSWTEIGQIVGEVEDSHLKVVKCRDGYYDLDGFIKSSPSLIDVLEIGDYVNGYIVKDILDNGPNGLVVQSAIDFLYEREIKTIVTKEMYSSVEYRVENN